VFFPSIVPSIYFVHFCITLTSMNQVDLPALKVHNYFAIK
jgi:hypothetical protein